MMQTQKDLRPQGISQKYELNRKWFYLYGRLPSLRHGIPFSCLLCFKAQLPIANG